MGAPAFDHFADDGVLPVPRPRRHLYAVRGTVGEPSPTTTCAPAWRPAPAGRPDRPIPLVVAAPAADEPRLDALIDGAWEALSASASSACPLCGSGTLIPHPWSPGGACGTCGTTLG